MGAGFSNGGANFTAAENHFLDIHPDIVARILRAATDIALILDGEGRIVDYAMGEVACDPKLHESWIGKSFHDIVTVESRRKVEQLLAQPGGRLRQVNHPCGGEDDLPVEYAVFDLGQGSRRARNGHDSKAGLRIALGRDLSDLARMQRDLVEAQLGYSGDLERIRGIEAQYRVLFETASDRLLVVDPASRTIIEANGAAITDLSSAGAPLVGRPLDEIFDRASRPELDRLLAHAYSSGQLSRGRLAMAGRARGEVGVSVRFFRREGVARLSVVVERGSADLPSPASAGDWMKLHVENGPEAALYVDGSGTILRCNKACLDLLDLADSSQLHGRNADEILGRNGTEMATYLRALSGGEAPLRFNSTVRTGNGTLREVEVSGILLRASGQICHAFFLWPIDDAAILPAPAGGPGTGAGTGQAPRPPEELVGLVGTMPLRDIVGQTSDIIERLCIEAALELTAENKASAAEMLGLSRQALYTKLRRYGIHGETDGRATTSS